MRAEQALRTEDDWASAIPIESWHVVKRVRPHMREAFGIADELGETYHDAVSFVSQLVLPHGESDVS